jgi:hypothetical protein
MAVDPDCVGEKARGARLYWTPARAGVIGVEKMTPETEKIDALVVEWKSAEEGSGVWDIQMLPAPPCVV